MRSPNGLTNCAVAGDPSLARVVQHGQSPDAGLGCIPVGQKRSAYRSADGERDSEHAQDVPVTLIHLVSMPTNTSVSPACSTGPALFVGGGHFNNSGSFGSPPLSGAPSGACFTAGSAPISKSSLQGGGELGQ
jgi:hypothetical protein